MWVIIKVVMVMVVFGVVVMLVFCVIYWLIILVEICVLMDGDWICFIYSSKNLLILKIMLLLIGKKI